MPYKLTDIIDIDSLKKLFQSYSDITGTVLALLNLEGDVLIATAWQDICVKFHRINPDTAAKCRESDTVLAGQLKEGNKYNVYRCRNGLVDVAVPIVAGGVHVGNLFTGQFFSEPPDKEFFSQQAARYGFDPEAYLEALSRVPVFKEEEVRKTMEFLCSMAVAIGETGITKLKLIHLNAELEEHRMNLEGTVRERTRELKKANDELQEEIRERKRAEDALKPERDKLMGIMNAMKDGIYIVNSQCDIEYINPVIEREFGEVKGRKCFQYFHDRTEVCPWCKNDEVMSGKSVIWEWYSSKNGKHYELFDTPLKNADGSISKFEIFHDITERKKGEEALKDALLKNKRFTDAMDNISSYIYMKDLNRQYIYANKITLDLFKCSVEELVGSGDEKFFPPETAARLAAIDERVFRGETTKEEIDVSPGAPERRVYWEVKHPIYDEAGMVCGLCGISTDITDQKKLEEEIIKAKEKAEQATRLKDQFISLVSHDLRAPFASIKGFTLFALNDKAHPLHPIHREMMERIGENSDRMLTMIEELLQISRLQTGKIVPRFVFIDGREVSSFAIGSLSHLAKAKGIELMNDVPARTRLFTDSHLFGQVLLNLVSNAIKFCKEGGVATFFVPEGKGTTIAVKDTGMGIIDNLLAHLFSHETKTSTPGTGGERGTGLGLPLSQDIMRALGGNLRAESKKGEGSVFYAELPYVRPIILVVDDDKAARLSIKSQLEDLDVDIMEAENGREALQIMGEKAPHLIITGLSMPVMDGFEFLAKTQDNPEFKTIPKIVITPFENIPDKDKIFQIGANNFISKPLKKEDFIPMVRKFII